MAGTRRFAVALAAVGAALVLGPGPWRGGPASLAVPPAGRAPADAAGGAPVAAVEQVALAIDGMT